MTELKRVHRCQFCGKNFARKSWFLRHSCAKKRKFEETNDVIVQHGFRLYIYWMKIQNMIRRGKEPNMDKFLKSRRTRMWIGWSRLVYVNGIGTMIMY